MKWRLWFTQSCSTRSSSRRTCCSPPQCGPHPIIGWGKSTRTWPFQPRVSWLRQAPYAPDFPVGLAEGPLRLQCSLTSSALPCLLTTHPSPHPTVALTLHSKLQLSICFWRILTATKIQLYAVHERWTLNIKTNRLNKRSAERNQCEKAKCYRIPTSGKDKTVMTVKRSVVAGVCAEGGVNWWYTEGF